MITSGAFGYIDVLTKAADASWTREQVITNNISNNDTPGYKRKDVTFARQLNSVIQSPTNPYSTLTQRVNNADLSLAKARVYTDNATLSYRLDGNNVDIETENAELASEQINYNALIDSMTNEFSRVKSVLK